MYQQLYRKKNCEKKGRSNSNACCGGRPRKNTHLSSRRHGCGHAGAASGKARQRRRRPIRCCCYILLFGHHAKCMLVGSPVGVTASAVDSLSPPPKGQQAIPQKNDRHQPPRTVPSIGRVCKVPMALRDGGNFTAFFLSHACSSPSRARPQR